MKRKQRKFRAEILSGHKDDAVEVPFDPEKEWGIAVTGKSFEVVAMEWFVFKDGKIHRRWGARDNASQFRQMGLPLG